jgi:hypothetical protein
MENGTDNGTLGLQRPNLWSEEAISFLPITMSALSKQLAKISHSIIKEL